MSIGVLVYCNLTMRRDKSFVDDLIVHRGVVSGRVTLLLRSAETKPLMPRFVPLRNLPTLFVGRYAYCRVEITVQRLRMDRIRCVSVLFAEL